MLGMGIITSRRHAIVLAYLRNFRCCKTAAINRTYATGSRSNRPLSAKIVLAPRLDKRTLPAKYRRYFFYEFRSHMHLGEALSQISTVADHCYCTLIRPIN